MKITLIGDGAVGKTSLRRRYLGKPFQSEYIATIGADFAIQETNIYDHAVKFQIWDLSGAPGLSEVRKTYYQGSLGALLVFDVTRPHTLYDHAVDWIEEFWKYNGQGRLPFVLLGNKTDLRLKRPRSVSDAQAQKFCDEISSEINKAGFELIYLPTSALNGQNVTEAFETLGRVYFKFTGVV